MERPPPRRPDREDRHNGLAYALWLPDAAASPPPWPGVVVVHGAGSRKENHADFARLAAANGSAVDDVIRMVDLLAVLPEVDQRRVALRGSSLGGFLGICAAAVAPEIAGV